MLDIPKVVNIEDGPDGKKVIKLRVKSEGQSCPCLALLQSKTADWQMRFRRMRSGCSTSRAMALSRQRRASGTTTSMSVRMTDRYPDTAFWRHG